LVVRSVADRKLTQLDAFLGFLEKLGTPPADVFLADFVACGAARYYLQAAIECCADIGAHLIATDTKRRAEDYRSIFRILGEEGVIAADVATAMEPAASLRNHSGSAGSGTAFSYVPQYDYHGTYCCSGRKAGRAGPAGVAGVAAQGAVSFRR